MNEKIKNAWEWAKEHKKAILITAGAIALSACGIAIVKSASKPGSFINYIKVDATPKKLDIPDFGVGRLDDVMRYDDGTVEMWLDEIPLADMGKLGEEIAARAVGVPAKTWALLSIKPDIET